MADGSQASCDVAIVGCGPAGAMAARTLAEAGIDVILLDAAPLPRYKPCGGGLVYRAARMLPEDVEIPWQRRCHTAQFHLSDADLHFQVDREQPLLSMVMRADLDWALVRAAEEAGAEIWAPCRASAVRHRGKSLELTTADGTLTAEFLVIADGAVGTTARAAGWTAPLDAVPAIEWEIRVPEETLARYDNLARFDIGAVNPGYGWVFPKGDHLSVGVVSMKRGARELKETLERYLTSVSISEILERDCYGGLVPLKPRPTLTRGRALLVGDAAGLADPITAEGISSSLTSGRLAAEAIAASDFDPWKAQGKYEQALEREVLGELRLARGLARSLYNLPRGRAWFMQRFGQQFAEAMTDLFLGERTYRDTLLKPSNWYKLVRQYLRERRAS